MAQERLDVVFRRLVQLLDLMKHLASVGPRSDRIAIEMERYERELYQQVHQYSSLLRRYLDMDRSQTEFDYEREDELRMLKQSMSNDDFNAPPLASTMELPKSPVSSKRSRDL